MNEIYAAEIYSQSQICFCARMDMVLLKSRSSKLHGTPNSAMNLELSRKSLCPLVISCSFEWTARVVKFGNFCQKSADKSSLREQDKGSR